jgi:hypothetical protein
MKPEMSETGPCQCPLCTLTADRNISSVRLMYFWWQIDAFPGPASRICLPHLRQRCVSGRVPFSCPVIALISGIRARIPYPHRPLASRIRIHICDIAHAAHYPMHMMDLKMIL